MASWVQELRGALRGLLKDARSTSAAVATLAVGIGASTAIFSVVYGVLLRPLPYPDPERIVQVSQVFETGNRGRFSDPNFEDVRERNRSFSAFAQHADSIVSVLGGSEPVRARRAWVSREFWNVVAVTPILGRAFVDEELRPGGSTAVVVSYGFWQRQLGASPDFTSRRLELDGRVHTVVGVMPRGFGFPPETDLWTPRELEPRLPSRTAHNWRAIARLADGVSVERAHADVSAIARELKTLHGENTWMVDAAVVPLHEALVGNVRTALLVLMAAVGFLLLVAGANVVNLLLARASSRSREVAVRAALGASRWDLVCPFLAESFLLTFAGGGLGIVVAFWGVPLLLALEPGKLPRAGEIALSLPVLSFSLALAVVVSFGLGIAAALRSARLMIELNVRSHSGQAASGRLRSALVVSQVALTLVLLVGSGLLARSLLRLLEVDPGFRRDANNLVVDLDHPAPSSDADKRRLGRAQEEILGKLRALPGTRRAGLIHRFPLAGGLANGMFLVVSPGDELRSFEDFARLAADPARVGMADYGAATEGYFETMGIPLLRGRLFDERDAPEAPHVALISASLAREKWPGEDPIGKLIEFGNMDGDLRFLRVVGIVGDVRNGGLDSDARATIYTNARQRPPASYSLVVELAGDAAASVPSIRSIVREIAPDVPPRFRSIEEILAASIADRRFNAVLLGAFGIVALLLAVIGIYGVVARGVSERTREIGIRMALGARSEDVLGLVVGEGSRLIAAGVVLGVGLAIGLTRLLASLLFEVSPTDPATFSGLAVFLAAVAVFACYVPARRATRVDPMISLRYE